MNKAILMSIQPQHTVNILKGKKTLELRKNVPKNYVGWVYVYVTKGKPYLGKNHDGNIGLYNIPAFGHYNKSGDLNGKVVARLWFDEYIAYKYYKDDNSYFAKRPQDFGYNAEEVLKRLCLSRDEFKTYGKGKDLYAWHIKDLEIFKNPMELSEFYRIKNDYKQEITPVSKTNFIRNNENYKMMLDTFKVKRPPQSWQYVYVEGEEG